MIDDTENETPETAAKGERIAKVMARAGLCSRRDAERWIAEGRVSVNGQVLTTPACVVAEGDVVLVDGNPLPEAEKTRLWRYHKPAGLVTTHRDPKGRTTVFERLAEQMGDRLPRVISVGRLDLNSEGLLLVTNDGELARKLELPSTGWVRRYRVRVHGTVDEAKLAGLAKGLTVSGIDYGPVEAKLDSVQGSNAWLSVAITEGKNREVRKIMDHLGYPVTRLIRTAYGPFQLGKMERGTVEEVSPKVVREQLGTSKGGHAKAGGAKAGGAKAGGAKAGGAKASGAKGAPQKARHKQGPKQVTKQVPKQVPKFGAKPEGQPPARTTDAGQSRSRPLRPRKPKP